MKRRSDIWRKLTEEHLGKGMSYREVAEALGLPVGTVKTWVRRRRQGDMKPGMKPAAAQGKGVDMKPGMKPGLVHRGLTVEMMPGRTGWERRMTWSLFKRGEWPPKEWRIPAGLEGEALVRVLGERASKSRSRMTKSE